MPNQSNEEQPARFITRENAVNLSLAGVALGASYGGEAVNDPTARNILLGVAIATGTLVLKRFFGEAEQQPPGLQHDVFGLE